MKQLEQLYLSRRIVTDGVDRTAAIEAIRENQGLMQLAATYIEVPELRTMLDRARSAPAAVANAPILPRRLRWGLALATLLLVSGALLLRPVLTPPVDSEWPVLSLQFAAGEALESDSGYTAILDVLSLPYGMREIDELDRRLRERFEELAREEPGLGVVVYNQMLSGVAPMPQFQTMMFGVTEEQALTLLEAMAQTENLGNPRLAETVVFHQQSLLPKTAGGVRVDKGYFHEIKGTYFYFPESTPEVLIETELSNWHRARYGEELQIDVQLNEWGAYNTSQSTGTESKVPVTEVPPELHKITSISAHLPQYDSGELWTAAEVPVLPLAPGRHWVPGYQVTFQRYDATGDASIAALNDAIAQFVQQLGDRYDGGLRLAREAGRDYGPQPRAVLYVPLLDTALLDALGDELQAASLDATRNEPLLTVHTGRRAVFLDTAAGLELDSVVLDETLPTFGSGSYDFVFPAGTSDAGFQQEFSAWLDAWYELVPEHLRSEP